MISGFFAGLFLSAFFWLFGYCTQTKVDYQHRSFLIAVFVSITFTLVPFILGLDFTEYGQLCSRSGLNCRMGNILKISPFIGSIFGFLFYFRVYSIILTPHNNEKNQK